MKTAQGTAVDRAQLIATRKARKALQSVQRTEALDAAEKALIAMHPDVPIGTIESWAEDVIAYQRGKGERAVRKRVVMLLGAGHPLLRGGK